jgi:alpha-tubulin suppressor-like RCC1 family protein
MEVSLMRRVLLAVAVLLCVCSSSRAAVVGWGKNTEGALGAGFKGPALSPVRTQITGAQQVAIADSGYAIRDGQVYAWGDNTFGNLGTGGHVSTTLPEPVPGITTAVQVAAGATHAIVLLANGTVMTWGGNAFGSIGNGTGGHGGELGVLSPVAVPGLTGVVQVAAGGEDSAALLANGTVEGWGEDKSGQLGVGPMLEVNRPTPIPGLSGVKQVAVGADSGIGGHLVALLGNGTVMAVGGNVSGQLGSGIPAKLSTLPQQAKGVTHAAAVSAALTHSMALLENGTIMVWGDDRFGELGIPTAPETCANGPCSRLPVSVGLSDVTSVAAGYRFSVAVSDGQAFSWGTNTHGELGDGTQTPRSLPGPVSGLGEVQTVTAGESHALANITGEGPAPVISLTPGTRTLTVNWLYTGVQAGRWTVQWRPKGAHNHFSKPLLLPGTARAYTITGLTAQKYEVQVKGNTFGSRTVTGTPLS